MESEEGDGTAGVAGEYNDQRKGVALAAE